MQDIDSVVELAKSFVWSTQKDSSYWLYPPYLGTFFISQYYLVSRYLDSFENSKLNIGKFKEILLNTQRHDGGWQQVTDPSNKASNLDATIFNYWFLKASSSLSTDSKQMENARNFIISQGGLNKCSHMTKIWLCLFGQYNWDNIAYLPIFVFRDDTFYFKFTNVKPWVAQWVYPHVLPIAYLRYWKKQRFLGKSFDISELCEINNSKEVRDYTSESRPTLPPKNVENMIEKLSEIRRPLGTYGAYSVSTLFSLIAIQDYQKNWPEKINKDKKEREFKESIEMVEDLYFNSDSSSYLGVLDDGRWWDTLLITLGLLENEEDPSKLKPVIDHFIKYGVQKCGGIAYGLDFEYAPDTDDTGIMVLILAKYFKTQYADNVKLANDWLIEMQNSDGGFGAFAKENTDWSIVRLFAGNFQNSAEIFDSSSVDVTAHILEGWAESGHSLNDVHVQKAIQYLKAQQTSFGAWEGRWGVNYIYSVGAVISALTKFKGFDLKDETWLIKSIIWLMKCQNENGGFGESTMSYTNTEWIGKGVSTATQTAWAILVLVEVEKSKLRMSVRCK